MAMTGCILPPERELSARNDNAPPQVDLASLLPFVPISEVGPDCDEFDVEVGRVRDPDDENLLYRFVSNNKVRNTDCVRDDIAFSPRGNARALRARVVPRFDFREEFQAITEPVAPNCSPTTRTAVLSLFVTDAQGWADPDPDCGNGEALDLSLVAPPEDGRSAHVIEVRWALQFDSSAPGCPQ